MKKKLLEALKTAAATQKVDSDSVKLEYPEDVEHGDYATNIALVNAKKVGRSPRDLAEAVVDEFRKNQPEFIESVSIAGPGFINFKIKDEVFTKNVLVIAGDASFGKGKDDSGKKVMVEYTDPNPFKIFHIGHLMSNAIGESISRLVEYSGAEVIRACYQGDVGLHVAKTIWAILKQKQETGNKKQEGESATEKVEFLGKMYVEGAKHDDDPKIQKEIAEINKKIFDKSDPTINEIYENGRKWSLEYFDETYKLLGTRFDRFFFESEVAHEGVQIVKEFLKKGVFQESEGAVIFKGEDHGLHTRVFLTSQSLPTYEAKELGLNTEKFKLYPDLTESIIITANEQNDYFAVLLKALSLINPEIAKKTTHKSHGILRFASGKMASRKGNVISAQLLMCDLGELVRQKIIARNFTPAEAEEVVLTVALAAFKYTVLRQSIGGDVVFDSAASISFEGDSGPYLQYAVVRARSVLEKAEKEGLKASAKSDLALPSKVHSLEKLLARFPDIVARARHEYAPQHITQYLLNLASAFNNFYTVQPIISKDPLSPYYVTLTKVFADVMTHGLWLLGIEVPKRM